MKKDRFVAGALAGLVGAVLQNTWAFTIKSLGIVNKIYVDFATTWVGAVIFGLGNAYALRVFEKKTKLV